MESSKDKNNTDRNKDLKNIKEIAKKTGDGKLLDDVNKRSRNNPVEKNK